ncbi:MAG: DNA photolyase [Pseudomonadota bacterium]
MNLKSIFIDEAVENLPIIRDILDRHAHIPHKIISDASHIHNIIKTHPDPVATGKQILYLTKNKGRFIRPCPGTASYICCGYQILHIGTFCFMDCAYCILQAYFHPAVLQLFVNHDDMFSELLSIKSASESFYRIGTGEFTDSLAWDMVLPLSTMLVDYFSAQNRIALELKTKTIKVEQLAKLSHNRKTIVAWSLNTPAIIKSEESGTTPLDARLKAAAKCQAWGYPLAFHFDPLIEYKGWEEDYKKVIDRLFQMVDAAGIVWISLGAFRFMPDLKDIVTRRFPGSRLFLGEFVSGLDKKMRYLKPIRMEMYQRMVEWITSYAPDACIYFCMEDEMVWEKTLGFTPSEKGGLARMLDRSAAKHCDLKPSVHP